MPKSSKKRKDKAADFTKAKLKLGKGKHQPTNAVDTSFKARSIALPTQSIVVAKDDTVPTTKRKLTFDDLIAHLNHYSAGVRRDALLGLREIIDSYPDIVESSLTSLIAACVRRIGDEDASVRKSLLSFFNWFLPRVESDVLVPHSPMLLLFTTSAQTHIFPEIRIDAVRFLDLLLEVLPEQVVSGWNGGAGHGGRVLQGYLGILNAGTVFGDSEGPMSATSTASVVLTPASKLVVLDSLSRFLRLALSFTQDSASQAEPLSTIPTWFLRSSFGSSRAYDAFDHALRPVSSVPQAGSLQYSDVWISEEEGDMMRENCLLPASGWTNLSVRSYFSVDQLTDVTIDASDETSETGSRIAHLAKALQSTIVSTFLDCAPSVFAPSGSPSQTDVHLVVAVASIAGTLHGYLLRQLDLDGSNNNLSDLKVILGYMAPYFPCAQNIGGRDMKMEQGMQEVDLAYCDLTSLLILSSTKSAKTRPSSQAKPRKKDAGDVQLDNDLIRRIDRVGEHVMKLLRGEAMSSTSLARPLSYESYIALLPTIWSLLNASDSTQQDVSVPMLHATLDHAMKISSTSPVKKASLEFVGRLALLDTDNQYCGTFSIRQRESSHKFEEWIKGLPRTLWEVGAGSLQTSEVILRFMLRLHQRKSRLVNNESITSLKSRLAPFFSVNHATRGQLLGPYSKFPVKHPVRRLTLDVVATLCMADGTVDGALYAAVEKAVEGTDEACYWTHCKQLA